MSANCETAKRKGTNVRGPTLLVGTMMALGALSACQKKESRSGTAEIILHGEFQSYIFNNGWKKSKSILIFNEDNSFVFRPCANKANHINMSDKREGCELVEPHLKEIKISKANFFNVLLSTLRLNYWRLKEGFEKYEIDGDDPLKIRKETRELRQRERAADIANFQEAVERLKKLASSIEANNSIQILQTRLDELHRAASLDPMPKEGVEKLSEIAKQVISEFLQPDRVYIFTSTDENPVLVQALSQLINSDLDVVKRLGLENEDFVDIPPTVGEVNSPAIRIMKREVSQKIWTKFMGYNPSTFKGEDLPVENVSFSEIDLMLARISSCESRPFGLRYGCLRLPTEGEWIRMAKNASPTDININRVHRVKIESPFATGLFRFTLSVFAGIQNKSLQLSHVFGNVSEWVIDTYDYRSADRNSLYNYLPVPDHEKDEAAYLSYRTTIKGKSWNDDLKDQTLATLINSRTGLHPDTSRSTVGFRLVQVIE